MAFDDAIGREIFEGLDEDDYEPEPDDDDLELTGDDDDEPDDLELL